MKRLVAIVYSGLFIMQAISPSMDFCCELTKLPAMFEHYQEHVVQDNSSLLDFLAYHYGNSTQASQHQHSDDHDEKLPFHGQHQCAHGMAFITSSCDPLQTVTPYSSEQSRIGFYTFSVSSAHPDALLQPPRG